MTCQPKPGLLHHTDRGSQYASHDYQAALRAAGLVSSMSRRGKFWESTVAESFFATLKHELCHLRNFASRDEARRAIFEYIGVFYNRQRLHSSLDYRSPSEYEALHANLKIAA